MGKKKIKRDNLELEFEDDIELMKRKVIELERLKKIILESSEFKLLDGKTQMVGIYKEEENNGGIHSRGEHTECVAMIAKDIVSKIYDRFGTGKEKKTEFFQLNKKISELYAEIMGYSHDLGHTPFGHVGESGLNDFMEEVSSPDQLKKILEHRRIIFGKEYEEAQGHSSSYKGKISFEHNEQSANLFYDIVKRNDIDTSLVDYRKIIWGILGHSVSRVDLSILPEDLSVRAIRIADKIEYINKDYEELSDCLVKPKASNVSKFVKDDYETRVNKVINNLVNEAFEYGMLDEDMASLQILNRLKEISNNCVLFVDKKGKRGLIKDENVERLKMITYKLALYYYKHPSPEIDRDEYWRFQPLNPGKLSYRLKGYRSSLKYDECRAEKVIRFVSSMDNARCQEVYKKLVMERILKGEGYGIEPINKNDIKKKKKQQLLAAANGLKRDFYRLSDDEIMQKVKNDSQKYIKKKLSRYGKAQLQNNRKKHAKEVGIDFFAYSLMEMADSMRNIGKSPEEVSRAILNELQNNKDKTWQEEKYEIVPYDSNPAKISRGEYELEK